MCFVGGAQGRPQGSPLRKGNMKCVGAGQSPSPTDRLIVRRATARVAPAQKSRSTYKRVVEDADPYEKQGWR